MNPPEDLPPSGSFGGSIPPAPETTATADPAQLPRHVDSDGGDGTTTVKAKRQVSRSLQKTPNPTKAAEPMAPVASVSQKQHPSVPTRNVKKRGKGGDGQLEVRAGDGAEPPLPAEAPVGSAGLLPGAYSVSADGDVSIAGNVPSGPSTANVPSTVVAGGAAPFNSFREQSRYNTAAEVTLEATLAPENSNRDPRSSEQPISVAFEDKPLVTAMKDRRIQLCLVFVALAFVGLAVGLGVGLSGGDSSDDDKTSKLDGGLGQDFPAPSPSPTTSRVPTMSPSRSFAPTIRPWLQLGQIINNFSRRANFGFSVSMSDDGTRLVAGAPQRQKTGDGITIVRVYDYEEGRWIQVGSDLVGDALKDGFGQSVSVSGNKERIAVGAPLVGAGHAKVFQLDQSGNWSLVGAPIVGNVTGENTGKSVSLSQNASILAVGAHGYVDVYKYEDESGDWTQIGQRLEEGNVTYHLGFGASVDLSSDGGTLAIGEPHYNDTGRVSVFAFQNNSWTQIGEDLHGDLPKDRMGRTLSFSDSGTTLAVGAERHDGPAGKDSGLVRVFKYDSEKDEWAQKGGDLVGMRKEDNFGRGLSLSGDGNIVGVGAWKEDVFVPDNRKEDSGRVRVYKFVGNSWEQIGDNIDALGMKDGFGYALSLSQNGSRVAIGAYKHDSNNTLTKVAESGQVVVYEWTDL